MYVEEKSFKIYINILQQICKERGFLLEHCRILSHSHTSNKTHICISCRHGNCHLSDVKRKGS